MGWQYREFKLDQEEFDMFLQSNLANAIKWPLEPEANYRLRLARLYCLHGRDKLGQSNLNRLRKSASNALRHYIHLPPTTETAAFLEREGYDHMEDIYMTLAPAEAALVVSKSPQVYGDIDFTSWLQVAMLNGLAGKHYLRNAFEICRRHYDKSACKFFSSNIAKISSDMERGADGRDHVPPSLKVFMI